MRGAERHRPCLACCAVVLRRVGKATLLKARGGRMGAKTLLARTFPWMAGWLDKKHRLNPRRHRRPVHPGPYADGVWGEIERAMAYKGEDESPRHALTRLARKMCDSDLPWLDESTCAVERVRWTIEDCSHLSLVHDRAEPRETDGPGIVVHHGNTYTVIDGNNRINWRRQSGSAKPMELIIIRPLTGTSTCTTTQECGGKAGP